MNRTRSIAALIVSLLVMAPAGAASNVSVQGVRDGTDAVVSGTFEKAASPFVRMAEDAAGDATPAGGPVGADLRGFDIQTTDSGDIAFRWVLESLPAPTSGLPGPVYGFTFIVDGEQGYELDVSRLKAALPADPSAGSAALWECVGTDCTPDTQTRTNAIPAVAFDAAAKTITAVVKASDIKVSPGSLIEETAIATGGAVFVGSGVVPSPYLYNTFDAAALQDAYRVGAVGVTLGSAPVGTDPAAVGFSTPASVAGTGFSGRVPTAAGDAVFARACTASGKVSALDQVCATAASGAIP